VQAVLSCVAGYARNNLSLEAEVSCAGRVELLQAEQHNMSNKENDAESLIDYEFLRLRKYMKEKF
jgi:hypothetical protein